MEKFDPFSKVSCLMGTLPPFSLFFLGKSVKTSVLGLSLFLSPLSVVGVLMVQSRPSLIGFSHANSFSFSHFSHEYSEIML